MAVDKPRDAVATMGTILPNDVNGRDAVHIAVIAVTATTDLEPGEDVDATGDPNGKHVGIVDPFLKKTVKTDQRFWLYLYPRTITGLSHYWSHPDFPEIATVNANKEKSERWLKDFCRDNDVPNYDDLLQFVRWHHEDRWGDNGVGGALYIGDMDCQANIPDEFWDHIEVVTGLRFEKFRRAEYFRCAC
jgi:hypothetical protein